MELNFLFIFYGRIVFYFGGGYVVEFGDFLEEIVVFVKYFKLIYWIDKYIRVVFIEGVIYNFNMNFIGVIEIGVEVMFGNVFLLWVDFKIFRLFVWLDFLYVFNLVCELLFFVIIFYILYMIIKGIY